MAKAKMPKTPVEIVKLAEAQGFRVQTITHGWFIWAKDGSNRKAWITRNTHGLCMPNNRQDAKRIGVVW
ncbi:hypothetical protein [Micromonospora coerulea]|uniref:hypothetical protein n=1 Tax=Micromonospora coerulea TaxID=47856 RepID=UPI001906DC5C|nr:hypothetical protein [Micromonospora veneta]